MGQWFFPPGGTSNLGELADRLSRVMIRRTKQEVLKDLPELTRTLVPVQIDNMSDYKVAIHDLKEWLKEEGKEVKDPNHVLTKLNVLRQVVGRGKVFAAIEMAESILDADRKVVLFAHHKETVTSLYDALKKYGCLVIAGDTPAKERAKNSNLFLSLDSGIRVMIITIAGAEGIDLYSASDIIFVEREWTPAKEEQAEARLHRIGQRAAVTAWYIVAKKTVDEKLAKVVQEKRKIIGQVIRQDQIVQQILQELEAQ
jgi:SNF2 family DNA or RNA helicase